MTTATMTRAADLTAAAAADEATEAAVSPELLIAEDLHADGALFNIAADRRSPTGPVMSGSIRNASGLTVPVSGFHEIDEESGEIKYLSLSIGGKDRTHFYGKLFRNSNESGPHYTGFIVVLPVDEGSEWLKDDWEKAERLQVCGWRRRSADRSARISLSIAPRLVKEGELAF